MKEGSWGQNCSERILCSGSVVYDGTGLMFTLQPNMYPHQSPQAEVLTPRIQPYSEIGLLVGVN